MTELLPQRAFPDHIVAFDGDDNSTNTTATASPMSVHSKFN
jgi:hypothetical protein